MGARMQHDATGRPAARHVSCAEKDTRRRIPVARTTRRGKHSARAALLTAVLSWPVAACSQIPLFDHVVVVVMENHSQSEIIGNTAKAPYINSLASDGANFTQSFAVEHPSEPNYLDLFSGSNQGVTDDSCPHTFSTANLGAQFIEAGLSFSGYSEDLPSVGSTVCTSGLYARKHNPWVNFTVSPNAVPASANKPFA